MDSWLAYEIDRVHERTKSGSEHGEGSDITNGSKSEARNAFDK